MRASCKACGLWLVRVRHGQKVANNDNSPGEIRGSANETEPYVRDNMINVSHTEEPVAGKPHGGFCEGHWFPHTFKYV